MKSTQKVSNLGRYNNFDSCVETRKDTKSILRTVFYYLRAAMIDTRYGQLVSGFHSSL